MCWSGEGLCGFTQGRRRCLRHRRDLLEEGLAWVPPKAEGGLPASFCCALDPPSLPLEVPIYGVEEKSIVRDGTENQK